MSVKRSTHFPHPEEPPEAASRRTHRACAAISEGNVGPELRARARFSLPERHREGIMPRYYFHVRTGGSLRRDPDGRDLPDIDAARKSAVAMACRTWSENPP